MSSKSTSSSTESKVSNEFLEFAGTTIFAPTPSPTYRYSMTLKSGKLRIWLEDCESKRQWRTSDLELDNFVNPANAIPDATATEYAEFFRSLLDKHAEDAGALPRAFRRIKGDVFRLELKMKFHVLMHSRVATYTFELEPITVERIDVLESRVRDLQAQVKTLQTEADQREASISDLKEKVKTLDVCPKVIQAQATTSVSQVVIWGEVGGHINGIDGIIRNLDGGLYEITASLSYVAHRRDHIIQLMKGTECIRAACCAYSGGGYASSSTLTAIVRVEIGEQLSFLSTADLSGQTCYLTLVRMGNEAEYDARNSKSRTFHSRTAYQEAEEISVGIGVQAPRNEEK